MIFDQFTEENVKRLKSALRTLPSHSLKVFFLGSLNGFSLTLGI